MEWVAWLAWVPIADCDGDDGGVWGDGDDGGGCRFMMGVGL
jgi:hypothetical protein